MCVRARENLKVYLGLWGKTDWITASPSSGRGGDFEKTHYTNGHGHSPMCNTLRNEKMVWNFLSLSLFLGLARFFATQPSDVKNSIKFLAKRGCAGCCRCLKGKNGH